MKIVIGSDHAGFAMKRDVDVMCLGAQIVGPWLGRDLITAYLGARFSTEEEFRRRVARLADLEAGR